MSKRVALVLLVVAVLLAPLVHLGITKSKQALKDGARNLLIETNERGVIKVMRELAVSTKEDGDRTMRKLDRDGDGVADAPVFERVPGLQEKTAHLYDKELAGRDAAGYRFSGIMAYHEQRKVTESAYIAVPLEPGVSGVRSFYVGGDGVIRATSDGTTPSATSPPIPDPE